VVALVAAVGGGYWLGQAGKAQPEHAATGAVAGPAAEATKKQPKLLYYRNPMGLADTSPCAQKRLRWAWTTSPCMTAMTAADEPASANQVKISTDKVQKLGVRTEAAQLRSMDRSIRAAGRVEPDERRIAMIAPKFEGYVERLHVNVTGTAGRQGSIPV
jgi:Cu(I)/Ag(I) efflux system membrane fusion protein